MDKNIQKIKSSGIFTNYIYKAIPLAFDESMSYYETLCGILSLLKTQEEVVNNNADLLAELELYVQNYFKNLDVQTEINNKLDQMAESGQLTDIIAQYLGLAGVLAYNTVNDLINAENIVNGSIVRTLGLNTYNDGKGAYYKIRPITSSDVVDGVNIIALNISNTLIAEKISDYYINELNKKINEVFDYDIIVDINGSGDYTSLSEAVANASNNQKIYVKNGTYNNEIVNCIGKYLTIVGESRKDVIIQNSTQAYSTPVFNIGKGILKNLTIKENGVSVSSSGGYALHVDNDDLKNNTLLIDNCYLYSGSQSAIGIGLRPNGTVYIKDSELYTDFTRTASDNNGALFCHTSNEEEGAGQLLKLENCYIHSKNTCAIKLQSCKSSSNTGYLEAYNVSLYSDYYKYKSELVIRDLYSNASSHNMLLSPKNSCNTSILNHTNYSNQYDVTFDKFLNDQVEYPIKRKILTDSINGTKNIELSSFENFGDLINVYGFLTETSSGLCIPLFYKDDTNYFRLFKHPSGYLSLSSNLVGTFQLIVEYWANTQ